MKHISPMKGITGIEYISFQALNEDREKSSWRMGSWGTMFDISWMELGVGCHDILEITWGLRGGPGSLRLGVPAQASDGLYSKVRDWGRGWKGDGPDPQGI